MVLIGVVLVFAAVIVWEVPALVKKELWGELLIFAVLLLVGMIYSIGLVLDYPLPNPIGGLTKIVEAFSGPRG